MHKQIVCKIIITSKELFECPDFVISDPGGKWTLIFAHCYVIQSNMHHRTCKRLQVSYNMYNVCVTWRFACDRLIFMLPRQFLITVKKTFILIQNFWKPKNVLKPTKVKFSPLRPRVSSRHESLHESPWKKLYKYLELNSQKAYLWSR